MTLNTMQQLQLDLIALRAQEDRLTTEAVLRRDWDNAGAHAVRSDKYTQAIHRMLINGRPQLEVPAPADGGSPTQ